MQVTLHCTVGKIEHLRHVLHAAILEIEQLHDRALQLGQASQVAPIDKLSVIFVLIFAALFLHEPLTLRTGLGGLLIVGGALVLAWK